MADKFHVLQNSLGAAGAPFKLGVDPKRGGWCVWVNIDWPWGKFTIDQQQVLIDAVLANIFVEVFGQDTAGQASAITKVIALLQPYAKGTGDTPTPAEVAVDATAKVDQTQVILDNAVKAADALAAPKSLFKRGVTMADGRPWPRRGSKARAAGLSPEAREKVQASAQPSPAGFRPVGVKIAQYFDDGAGRNVDVFLACLPQGTWAHKCSGLATDEIFFSEEQIRSLELHELQGHFSDATNSPMDMTYPWVSATRQIHYAIVMTIWQDREIDAAMSTLLMKGFTAGNLAEKLQRLYNGYYDLRVHHQYKYAQKAEVVRQSPVLGRYTVGGNIIYLTSCGNQAWPDVIVSGTYICLNSAHAQNWVPSEDNAMAAQLQMIMAERELVPAEQIVINAQMIMMAGRCQLYKLFHGYADHVETVASRVMAGPQAARILSSHFGIKKPQVVVEDNTPDLGTFEPHMVVTTGSTTIALVPAKWEESKGETHAVDVQYAPGGRALYVIRVPANEAYWTDRQINFALRSIDVITGRSETEPHGLLGSVLSTIVTDYVTEWYAAGKQRPTGYGLKWANDPTVPVEYFDNLREAENIFSAKKRENANKTK
jgi:hypothetical protein